MLYRLTRYRTTHRLGFLVAVVALVVQNLAWSLMPVYAAETEEGWVTVCTSEGIKKIPLSQLGVRAGGTPQGSAPQVLNEHCDLCVFAHGLGTLPSAGSLAAPVDRVFIVRALSPDQAFFQLLRAPQQPRAPPRL